MLPTDQTTPSRTFRPDAPMIAASWAAVGIGVIGFWSVVGAYATSSFPFAG